jgi:hypothetical protein
MALAAQAGNDNTVVEVQWLTATTMVVTIQTGCYRTNPGVFTTSCK